MPPIQVDVIAPLPEGWGLCVTCEAFLAQASLDKPPQDRSLEAFPPEWMEDFSKLSEVVLELSQKYGSAILIRLFDPQSVQGMVKCVRHRVRKYPTFIVQGHNRVVGLDVNLIGQAIQAALEQTGTT
jgi:hypothetical protein